MSFRHRRSRRNWNTKFTAFSASARRGGTLLLPLADMHIVTERSPLEMDDQSILADNCPLFCWNLKKLIALASHRTDAEKEFET